MKVESYFSHPFDLITIHKFNVTTRTAPRKTRLCEIHNEPVTLDYNHYGGNSFGAVPFEAVLTGCCNQAIDKEWKFIRQTVENS